MGLRKPGQLAAWQLSQVAVRLGLLCNEKYHLIVFWQELGASCVHTAPELDAGKRNTLVTSSSYSGFKWY